MLQIDFVQFRSKLVQEEIDEEAVFTDGTKIEASPNKFTFFSRKSIERYSSNLIEKSNRMYNKLLKNEIIPSIERENEQELSVEELEDIVKKLDHTVETYTKKIDESNIKKEQKQLSSERK